MNTHEKLSYVAPVTVLGVLAAMWLCRDSIISGLKSKLSINAKERLRLWSLKMRGLEDYVGRHRVEVLA